MLLVSFNLHTTCTFLNSLVWDLEPFFWTFYTSSDGSQTRASPSLPFQMQIITVFVLNLSDMRFAYYHTVYIVVVEYVFQQIFLSWSNVIAVFGLNLSSMTFVYYHAIYIDRAIFSRNFFLLVKKCYRAVCT